MDLSLSSLTAALETSISEKAKSTATETTLFRKNGGLDMNALKFGTTTTSSRPKRQQKKKCEVLSRLEEEGCLNDEALMRDIRDHKKKMTKKQRARADAKMNKKKKKKRAKGAAYADRKAAKVMRRQRKRRVGRRNPY
jgi:hypothetical protein